SDDVPFVSVWQSLFWNRRVDRVYRLLNARVPGLSDVQQPSVGPEEDGRLVAADGSSARGRFVVASSALGFFGSQVAYRFAPSLVLWRVAEPVRLAQWVQVVRSGELVSRVEVREYACRGGTLRLTLVSPVDQKIVVARHDRTVRVLRLRAGQRWSGAIAGIAQAHQCKFELVPDRTVALEKVEFVRPAP